MRSKSRSFRCGRRSLAGPRPDAPPEEITFHNGGFDDRGLNRVIRRVSTPTLTVYHPAASARAHRGAAFVVLAGGCDHYVYPRYKLGNLMNTSLGQLVDSAAQQSFGGAKSAGLPRYCRECPVRFACHGECPKHRILTTPHGEPGLNCLCAGYRKFFRHIDSPMRTMVTLLHTGRAPAVIMQLPREQWIRGGLRLT